jgi:hypothetical protein
LDINITAPAAAWELDDRISIYEGDGDKPLLMIPIRARVLPRVRVIPASIVLPRMVRDAANFTGECTLASTAGRTIRVTPVVVPPEISATRMEAHADGCSAVYRLEWRTDHRPPKGQSRTVTLRFRAKVDGTEDILTVPVHCRID